jgi:hypothetical protein
MTHNYYFIMTDFLGRVDIKNISGSESRIKLQGDDRIITLFGSDGKESITLDGNNNSVALRDKAERNSIILDGDSGNMTLYDADGHRGFALLSKAPSLGGNTTGMWIGANRDEGQKAGFLSIRDKNGIDSIILNGTNNSVALKDTAGRNSIILDGVSGDIILNNADCAEDFDIAESAEIEPGTVMVIDKDGKLRQSNMPYDKRVAGVLSGAQNYKPGLVLDKRKSTSVRKSVSLMGKVYCKADSQYGSIEVGDLLTTSKTPGHAMKAVDPVKAFGSVIGKALGSLSQEIGLIPILVTLQ